MLSVVMLSVITLNVVIVSVMVPHGILGSDEGKPIEPIPFFGEKPFFQS
jgi:hypothetical protein